MSNEQFARFYWPSLKTLLVALIDAGVTPMPFFEGDYLASPVPPGAATG